MLYVKGIPLNILIIYGKDPNFKDTDTDINVREYSNN